MGRAYTDTKKYNKALRYYGKVMKIEETYYGSNSPALVDVYSYIGDIYFYTAEYHKALQYLNKALTISREEFDEEDSKIIQIKERIDTIERMRKY